MPLNKSHRIEAQHTHILVINNHPWLPLGLTHAITKISYLNYQFLHYPTCLYKGMGYSPIHIY